MKWFIIIFSQITFAANATPTTFPVFLKEGFSSILEFEESPTQVVLGDQNLFLVERLGKSIVLKPLTPYATTNMFVYFKAKETKLFILTASEEAEPTFYKKFDPVVATSPVASAKSNLPVRKYNKGIQIASTNYDAKKDYLTVDFFIAADSTGKVAPRWDLIRLKFKDKMISPSKLWSERREAQRDSRIKARLIFTKPNVSADLKDVSIVVPSKTDSKPFTQKLKVGRL
ncbi:MAG: hypothetical protein JNM24_17600 [Bdellovibrionaceae bacterium]|nr:hypothetical protein [Pseudobdellovibrionaceae bacterium]